MAIVSHATGRWELVDTHRRIIAWRHPDNFDGSGRWHYVSSWADHTTQPYRDDDCMDIVEDVIESLIICRSGSTADAGALLSIMASLIAELEARLPEAIFDARDQGYLWVEIAQRLAMPESTIRHRYSDYVACRKEMPPRHSID